MAPGPRPRPVSFEPEDYAWVHSEIVSTLSRDGTETVGLLSEYVDDKEAWRLEAWQETPVCTYLPEEHVSFFFYAFLLERYQIRIPLPAFQQSVLRYLKIAPSQMSPTGWGFMKGFEAVMNHLGRPASEKVFMTQFEVFKPFKDEPGKTRFVYIHNHPSRAYFEAATDSNKGFKSHFFLVRAQPQARKAGLVKLDCPFSWTREHDDLGHKSFNLRPADLVGEERESFDQLDAWGSRLKRGLRKFYCNEIIKKSAESPEALKVLLGNFPILFPLALLTRYFLLTDPSFFLRSMVRL